MKTTVIFAILFIASSAVAASQDCKVAATKCDCLIYPYTPNPPCYGCCIQKIVANTSFDLSKIKNLDPEVSYLIEELSSKPDKSKIDLSTINGKSDLEEVAMNLREKDSKVIVGGTYAAAGAGAGAGAVSGGSTAATPAIGIGILVLILLSL